MFALKIECLKRYNNAEENLSAWVGVKMIDLSSREIELLKSLINKEKVTVKDFAKANFISTRTVYREINHINSSLKDFEARLVNKADGLEIDGSDKDIMDLRIQFLELNSEGGSCSRKSLILAELLQLREPIKIQYFASKFNLSRATVSNYLKDIKKLLEDQHIHLISKPGIGVYIDGNENDIRHAITDFLYKNFNILKLPGFIEKQNENPSRNNMVEKLNRRLLNIVDYNTISLVERALAYLEKTENYTIDDRIYIELAIHISVAIKRLQNNERIRLDSCYLDNLKKFHEFKIAKTIAEYIEKKINIEIPEEEIGYITIHLKGSNVVSSSNIDEKNICSLTDIILRKASELFKFDFAGDNTLRQDLNMHLSYSIYRIKTGYENMRNPLLQEIKNQYSDIYNKCNKVMDIARGKLSTDINEDEIGYITMHFAASLERNKYLNKNKKYNVLLVCASGLGTSRMLSAKIKEIGQINIAAISSVLKIDEFLKNYNIDLVISTIPIIRNDIRVIVVNPLFNEIDIKKLENELSIDINLNSEEKELPSKEKQSNVKDIGEYGYEINILKKNTVYAEVDAKSPEDIIKKLLNEAEACELVSRNGAENIKLILEEREKIGTIVIPNKNFAIFHCASSHISESILIIGKLKKPITLINLIDKKEKVNTVFLMAAPENRKKSIETIGDISSAIITDKSFLDNIIKSKSKEECKKLIEEALLKNLYKQIIRVES